MHSPLCPQGPSSSSSSSIRVIVLFVAVRPLAIHVHRHLNIQSSCRSGKQFFPPPPNFTTVSNSLVFLSSVILEDLAGRCHLNTHSYNFIHIISIGQPRPAAAEPGGQTGSGQARRTGPRHGGQAWGGGANAGSRPALLPPAEPSPQLPLINFNI